MKLLGASRGELNPKTIKTITESLAGRVAILEIPALSWNEAVNKKQSKFYQNLGSPELFKKLKPLYSKVAENQGACSLG